jgi:hypothetical protein
MDILADYKQKRARADSHFEILRASVNQFRDAQPVSVEGSYDSGLRAFLFEHPLPQIDPELALVIGDCVFNLRASLDYLMSALRITTGRAESNKTQFPIYGLDSSLPWVNFEAEWETHGGVAKQLDGTPDEAKDFLKLLQPIYGAPMNDPDSHPLAHLQAINNTDKHRRLNRLACRVDVTFLDDSGVSMFGGSPHGTLKIQQDNMADAHIVRLNTDRTDRRIFLRASCDVVFDEGPPLIHAPVLETLVGIRSFIDDEIMRAYRLIRGAPMIMEAPPNT